METALDDRIDLMDQGSFLGLRALGHQPVFLATWTYDRPVDLDALERLGLLEDGERDARAIGRACARFLAAAAALARIGDALWPDGEGD